MNDFWFSSSSSSSRWRVFLFFPFCLFHLLITKGYPPQGFVGEIIVLFFVEPCWNRRLPTYVFSCFLFIFFFFCLFVYHHVLLPQLNKARKRIVSFLSSHFDAKNQDIVSCFCLFVASPWSSDSFESPSARLRCSASSRYQVAFGDFVFICFSLKGYRMVLLPFCFCFFSFSFKNSSSAICWPTAICFRSCGHGWRSTDGCWRRSCSFDGRSCSKCLLRAHCCDHDARKASSR